MATTVNNAFKEFMKNVVNLDSEVVSEARRSRDNLLENITIVYDCFLQLLITSIMRANNNVKESI